MMEKGSRMDQLISSRTESGWELAPKLWLNQKKVAKASKGPFPQPFSINVMQIYI